MKKMLKSALALAMGAVMLMPVTAFAAEDEPTLISTQEVALSPSGANTRSAETKEFTLSTYEDNGRTVYSFDVEDEEYRQAAMEYINELTGDPGPTPQTRGILQPGESEYHNDTQYDGDAMSYAWKRNTAGQTDNNFEGGQSSLWSGSGNCDYIVLNQGISVSGIAVSISWPPSVSGSGMSLYIVVNKSPLLQFDIKFPDNLFICSKQRDRNLMTKVRLNLLMFRWYNISQIEPIAVVITISIV